MNQREASPLPSYLTETNPMELEDVPLQLALLTMEVAQLRLKIQELELGLTLRAIITDGS